MQTKAEVRIRVHNLAESKFFLTYVFPEDKIESLKKRLNIDSDSMFLFKGRVLSDDWDCTNLAEGDCLILLIAPQLVQSASLAAPVAAFQVGQNVEVRWRNGLLYNATILRIEGEQLYRVHYTGESDAHDEVVEQSAVTPRRPITSTSPRFIVPGVALPELHAVPSTGVPRASAGDGDFFAQMIASALAAQTAASPSTSSSAPTTSGGVPDFFYAIDVKCDGCPTSKAKCCSCFASGCI